MSKRKLDADEPAASGGSKPEAAGGTEGQQKPSLAIFVDLKRARAPGIWSFAGSSGMNLNESNRTDMIIYI